MVGRVANRSHGSPPIIAATRRYVAQHCTTWVYPTRNWRLGIVATRHPSLICKFSPAKVLLTRNFDKRRGFVNGALGEVYESLVGNHIFVVQLIGTGNLVLVHPTEERGQILVPCCYGYATTIRRAQGASLDCGCIYFNQKKRAAG